MFIIQLTFFQLITVFLKIDTFSSANTSMTTTFFHSFFYKSIYENITKTCYQFDSVVQLCCNTISDCDTFEIKSQMLYISLNIILSLLMYASYFINMFNYISWKFFNWHNYVTVTWWIVGGAMMTHIKLKLAFCIGKEKTMKRLGNKRMPISLTLTIVFDYYHQCAIMLDNTKILEPGIPCKPCMLVKL